jgi:phenylacetate-CoA ligase
MEILSDEQIDRDVLKLLEMFEKTQYKEHKIKPELISGPIITRDDLRNIKMEKGLYTCKSSGSTGEPVSVEKTYWDMIWTLATNIREIRWRKWDVTKNVAVIKTTYSTTEINDWGISKRIEPVQGKSYMNSYKSISELQEWLEDVNPHYIQCLPSILKELNVGRISNFIDWKGTGEVGGTMYSTEECGTIAILCPENSNVYHVMENTYVEIDTDGGIIVTSMTNPYIKRYKHGDHIEMGECTCGRTMQTIKEIKGRTRNMFTLPNGDKKWPLLGSHYFFERFGIKRFRAIQTSLDELELEIICEPLGIKENDVKSLINTMLDSPINVIIRYVETFPNYKFEEFISKI